MADNNNPNSGAKIDDRGQRNDSSRGKNPYGDQSAGQSGAEQSGAGKERTKDQGLGKGQQGNRELNEGGFEKGGTDRFETQ